jgi:hypothetical protein
MIDIEKAMKEANKAMLHHRPARRELGQLLSDALIELSTLTRYMDRDDNPTRPPYHVS